MYNVEIYCLDGEEWKDIQGYENIYQASSYGRIRSVDGKITHSTRHGVRRWKGRILKPKSGDHPSGYRVSLYKNKKYKDFLVARIICSTFHGTPDGFNDYFGTDMLSVNHKDGNRHNNNIDNLEWLKIKDNINHAFDNGLCQFAKKTILTDKHNNVHIFRSESKANEFLKKHNGYISRCIARNRPIQDVSGNEYYLG